MFMDAYGTVTAEEWDRYPLEPPYRSTLTEYKAQRVKVVTKPQEEAKVYFNMVSAWLFREVR